MPNVDPFVRRCGTSPLGFTSAPDPSISGWRAASATTSKMEAAGALMTRSALTLVAVMVNSVSSGPGRTPRLDGVSDQVAQLHPLQRGRVRGGQDDRGRHARLEGLLPTRGAQAPLVTGPQTVEAELRV